MKIFSGSSNQSLAKKIAKQLDTKLGDIELSQFPNGESRVWVKEKVSDEKCFVVQSFSNPPDRYIIEFCLIADALKRKGAKKIIAVIPWFGYCVQDKVFREGEPLNSKVIAKIVQATKLDQLMTVDLHNETILGFFDIPAEHLKATPIYVDFFKKNGIEMVISPDVGALKNTTKLAHALEMPIAVINKKRDLKTGKVKILGINQQVKGKRVLINDDFVSTGQTLMKTAAFLKEQKVKEVVACLTHHFYVPGVQEKIEKSQIDKLYVTDTITKPKDKKYKKLNILPIAPLLAEKIRSC